MSPAQSPRDRLIDTAAELFCRRGLPNVGINEVTECAGVARMTLYNNFSSKEDLALVAFERQTERRRVMIDEQFERCKSVTDKIAGLFVVAQQLVPDSNFRGCAFINVVAQEANPTSRLHHLARDHKLWIREHIQALVESAGARSSRQLAQQILALWDGAIVEAYIQGADEPIVAARDAAVALVKAATSHHTI